MFDADQPIENSDQDKLKRSVFAKYLARSLLNHQDLPSLVVGIEGAWGAGKSSILNLVQEELQLASSNLLETEQPILVNFDPWQQPNTETILQYFFNNLYYKLSQEEQLQDKAFILEALEQYMQHLHIISNTTDGTEKNSWFRKKSKKSTLTEDELFASKTKLDKSFSRLPRKIMIIIDNLSRLSASQIHEAFQIIKSLFNLNNTIYLIAFDKKQLIDKLQNANQHDTNELLEKMIQLPFHIPPIGREDIHLLLEDKIQSVIRQVPEDTWDREYWADIYLCYLRNFFKHCRDITRYINTLNFSYPRVRDVVNPVDFFAITVIELFLPEVYAGIRNNKDLFSDLIDHVYHFTPQEIEEDKRRCEVILALNKRYSKNILLDLLQHLFPRLRHLYQPEIQFYHSDTLARKNKRICNPDAFDIYFRMFITDTHISPDEFHSLLESSLTGDEFDHALARLNHDDRILAFLDHFDKQTIHNIPKKNITHIINGLIDDADLFPQEALNPLALNTSMRIHRILHYLLQRYDNSEDRFNLLQNAFNKANKSIYSIIHEINKQQQEHLLESDTYLPENFRDINSDQLNSLQQLAVAKIKLWASNGSLQEHPALLPILKAWHDWGDHNECEAYIKNITDTDKGLVAFLVSALDKAINQAMTHYEHNPLWDQYLNDIEALIPCKHLETHASEIFADGFFEKLREKEQLAIMIFLDLMKAQTKKDIPDTTGNIS